MAIPKLALIPSTQGDKLYSVLPANGVGDFAFTRGSSATRINSQGLIKTVASGVSRLNYPLIDGVVNGCPSHLLEPSRTNLIQYSEAFGNAYWTKSGSSVVSGFVSPKGDLSAFKFKENSDTSQLHYIYATGTRLNTTIYDYSIFAKYDGRNIAFRDAGGTGIYATFDLFNGLVFETNGINANITHYADNWYRIDYSLTSSSTNVVFQIFLLPNSYVSGAPLTTSNGDGTSGVYIFGAQLEQGSYPTSYIPTSGSAVTRSAETANGSGDASTFNDSEGVLMAEISALADGGGYRVISIEPATGTADRIIIYYDILEGKIVGRVDSAGTPVFNYTATVHNQTDFNKIALKYKQNDFALWINGIELGVDNTGNTPSGLNKLSFDNGVPADFFYGNAKQIQYYDSALNDSDLETLTSWTSFRDMANGQTYSIK